MFDMVLEEEEAEREAKDKPGGINPGWRYQPRNFYHSNLGSEVCYLANRLSSQ